MTTMIKTFGPVDARSLEQLKTCAIAGDAPAAVLCADHHPGYSQPIGGVVAYRDFISPSGVGYDIACGNKAVKTNLTLDVDNFPIAQIMDEIVNKISFGIGKTNKIRVDDTVIDLIRDSPFKPQRQLVDLAAAQLGTVGAGNHYVDLFHDEAGSIWIGVHFGSRGFGHKTASGFLAMAQGKRFDERAKDGEMDSPPVLFPIGSSLADDYIEAMKVAGEYAYAGRDAVCEAVLGILGAVEIESVHNHHNFAWQEKHGLDDVWVIRKGATPNYPNETSFIGGSMGGISVIVEGVMCDEAVDSLFSTVHGAGRAMSRTQAAGKWKRIPEIRVSPEGKSYIYNSKIRVGGKIDWPETKQIIHDLGIELRGAGPDEAPGAYKDLSQVLAAHAASTKILHVLSPIGVAMAGEDTYDPYKD